MDPSWDAARRPVLTFLKQARAAAAQNESMDTFVTSMAARFRTLLLTRANELDETLAHELEGVRAESETAGDFKDLAARDTQSSVEEAQTAHAAYELVQVKAALRRILDGTYGLCLACDEPIALERLVAMQAAAYCTDCQTAQDASGRRAA